MGKHIGKKARLVIAGLPLAGVVSVSLLPISVWMHQALVGITLLWLYAVLLLG
jgi:hypothetical protein